MFLFFEAHKRVEASLGCVLLPETLLLRLTALGSSRRAGVSSLRARLEKRGEGVALAIMVCFLLIRLCVLKMT